MCGIGEFDWLDRASKLFRKQVLKQTSSQINDVAITKDGRVLFAAADKQVLELSSDYTEMYVAYHTIGQPIKLLVTAQDSVLLAVQ